MQTKLQAAGDVGGKYKHRMVYDYKRCEWTRNIKFVIKVEQTMNAWSIHKDSLLFDYILWYFGRVLMIQLITLLKYKNLIGGYIPSDFFCTKRLEKIKESGVFYLMIVKVNFDK